MKQTAVQWLLEQYLKKDGLAKSDVSRALEMEKQQIIEALFTNDFDYETGEEYYNKTFDIKEIE
jgi:ABC-type nitrate/sulfonate/bicarbonate transport system substrate-binding protein